MTYTEQALKKAIEGGWKTPKTIRVDPLFWQALFCAAPKIEVTRKHSSKWQEQWRWQWHRFIDHLADGRTEESFFKELLK